MARLAENHSRAICDSGRGVGRGVVYAEVGLYFDDAPRGAAVNQDFSETLARNLGRVARIEFAFENVGSLE